MDTYTITGREGYDHHDALTSICAWLRPESYLEVGVDGGGSLASVVKASLPTLNRVVLCDIWNPRHFDHGFSTHEHIARMLQEYEYRGEVTYLDGDSRILVPQLPLVETFDLASVDGDHTFDTCFADLVNCWVRLRPGGVLVADDVTHPVYPGVTRAWTVFLSLASVEPYYQSILEGSRRPSNVAAVRKVSCPENQPLQYCRYDANHTGVKGSEL